MNIIWIFIIEKIKSYWPQVSAIGCALFFILFIKSQGQLSQCRSQVEQISLKLAQSVTLTAKTQAKTVLRVIQTPPKPDLEGKMPPCGEISVAAELESMSEVVSKLDAENSALKGRPGVLKPIVEPLSAPSLDVFLGFGYPAHFKGGLQYGRLQAYGTITPTLDWTAGAAWTIWKFQLQ